MELSGIALVVMDKAGSGNAAGAGAASSGGAMGTGPQGQHWERQGAKHCWGQPWWALLSLLRANPGCAAWEKGPWQGLGDARPGAAELPPPWLPAGVGWDGGCFGIRSGSGGAE